MPSETGKHEIADYEAAASITWHSALQQTFSLILTRGHFSIAFFLDRGRERITDAREKH